MEEAQGAGMDWIDRVGPPITISGEAGGANNNTDSNNNQAAVLGARPKVNKSLNFNLNL